MSKSKRLSSGFSGAQTKAASSRLNVDREVESRLGKSFGKDAVPSKRLDEFTDDFRPPGAHEDFPGADFRKQPFDRIVESRMKRMVNGTERADNADIYDQRTNK